MTFTVTGIDAVATGAVTVVSAASGTANTGTGNALNVAGTNRVPQGVGAQFSVTRTNATDSSTDYTEVTVVQEGSNYEIGDKLTISGASLGGSTPANDIVVRVQSVSSFGGVVSNTHSGTAIGGTGLSVYSSVTISDPTSQAIPLSQTISYSALATIRVDFTTPHGLVPGNAFLVVIISDDGANNHILASGPFLATAIPPPTQRT